MRQAAMVTYPFFRTKYFVKDLERLHVELD